MKRNQSSASSEGRHARDGDPMMMAEESVFSLGPRNRVSKPEKSEMYKYRALVNLPTIGLRPIEVEASSTYEAKAKLEAMYGVGNVSNPYKV
jgi:hypothetical protein